MNRLHISLDDVKGIFKALINNGFDSIFDTRTLSYLKYLHDKYGVSFNLFCTYCQEEYSLARVSEKYAREFKENSGWLDLCFHCFEEMDDYIHMEEDAFLNKYDAFMRERVRLTGKTTDVEILRIHRFGANESICNCLRKRGVRNLLCSDDLRKNYYLDDKENTILHKEYYYYDSKKDISFYKSCTRLEDAENILDEIERYKDLRIDVIPVFTHEWVMDREDVRQKLADICKVVS